MTRAETMTPAKVQIVPRGRWKPCLYVDNGDGSANVLIGAKEYTVTLDRVATSSTRG